MTTPNPSTLKDSGWMGDSMRGASFGRYSGDLDVGQMPRKSVHLSRVVLDEGYDPGGAYWGSPANGKSLYCAYGEATEEGGYCEYAWAVSRSAAAIELGLTDEQLKKTTTEK